MIGPKYVIRAERFSLKRRNDFIGHGLRLGLAPNRLRSFAEIFFASLGLSAELQQSAFASAHKICASERVEFHSGIPVLLKIPAGQLRFILSIRHLYGFAYLIGYLVYRQRIEYGRIRSSNFLDQVEGVGLHGA
jgi:hypothetical protein